MRRRCFPSLCGGWVLSLAIAQRLSHTNGQWLAATRSRVETATTATTRGRMQAGRDCCGRGRPPMAFTFHSIPSSFFASAGAPAGAAAAATCTTEERRAGWVRVPFAAAAPEARGAGEAWRFVVRGVRNRHCGGGVTCLEAKKSQIKAEEDEFRAAARELAKMEAKKKKKTKVRAQKREERKPRPPKAREGDPQDDQVALGKVGQNPFKKEKIVSKFDVNDIRKVEFVGSFDDKEEIWPRTNLPEIAFLGRSNVGKSSMLNTLFGEAVAKVSKTPGRTRQINIFKAKNSNDRDVCYFADLPGYGYAKMSKDKQRTIERFLGMYLERRSNLKLLVLLADSRREPLASDAGVLQYAEDKEDRLYKILLVATKVDKLNNMESVVNIKRLQEAFELPPGLPVSFSAVTGQGKKEIWSYIRQAAAAQPPE